MQVDLGERMARQVYEASKPLTPGGKGADDGGAAAGNIADEAKGWAGEEARVRRATGDFKRISDFAKSKKSSKLEAGSISQVRSSCCVDEVKTREQCELAVNARQFVDSRKKTICSYSGRTSIRAGKCGDAAICSSEMCGSNQVSRSINALMLAT